MTFVRSKSHHRVGQNFTSCTQRAQSADLCLNCMALMDRYLRLFCIFPNILHASRGGLSESAIGNMSQILLFPSTGPLSQIPFYICFVSKGGVTWPRYLLTQLSHPCRPVSLRGAEKTMPYDPIHGCVAFFPAHTGRCEVSRSPGAAAALRKSGPCLSTLGTP
jgi:hypothetical protein